jgi:hypothetical protein
MCVPARARARVCVHACLCVCATIAVGNVAHGTADRYRRPSPSAISGAVMPTTKCRLRLLKLERIKDFLLMEEEFIQVLTFVPMTYPFPHAVAPGSRTHVPLIHKGRPAL